MSYDTNKSNFQAICITAGPWLFPKEFWDNYKRKGDMFSSKNYIKNQFWKDKEVTPEPDLDTIL